MAGRGSSPALVTSQSAPLPASGGIQLFKVFNTYMYIIKALIVAFSFIPVMFLDHFHIHNTLLSSLSTLFGLPHPFYFISFCLIYNVHVIEYTWCVFSILRLLSSDSTHSTTTTFYFILFPFFHSLVKYYKCTMTSYNIQAKSALCLRTCWSSYDSSLKPLKQL